MRTRTRSWMTLRWKNGARARCSFAGRSARIQRMARAFWIRRRIDQVAAEIWPDVRDADELHDALLTLIVAAAGVRVARIFRGT